MVGDIMYYHQAMRHDNAAEFEKVVVKEINGRVDNDHWQLIRKSEIPDGHSTVPSVWSMQRKRDLTTLNVHGGKQTYGVN